MAERKRQIPQDAIDLDARAQKVESDAAAIRSYIDALKGSHYYEFQRMLAKRLFGQETKTVTAFDGTVTQVDYTDEDFFEYDQSVLEENEKQARVELAEDVSFGLNSQWRFTTTPNGKKYRETHMHIVDLTGSLLHRVISSPDSIADDRSLHITETRYEAEALEVMRRTILQPYYGVIEGYNEGSIHSIPSFFDVRGTFTYPGDPKMIAERQKLDKIREVQKTKGGDLVEIDRQLSADRIEAYTDQDWISIFEAEQIFLLEYLQECVRRTIRESAGSSLFRQKAVRGGELVFSDHEISEAEKRTQLTRTFKDQFAQFKTLADVEVWIKNTFGKDATFQTLLQTLNPIELQGSTEDFIRKFFIS